MTEQMNYKVTMQKLQLFKLFTYFAQFQRNASSEREEHLKQFKEASMDSWSSPAGV